MGDSVQSCGEPVSKRARLSDIFETFKRNEKCCCMLKSSFNDIRSQIYSLVPVKIRHCNAAYASKGFSFSKASCDTVLYERLHHFTKIFAYGEKVLQEYLEADVVPADEDTRCLLSKLLKYILNEGCHEAVKNIGRSKLSEAKLSRRLAHHLFSKLSPSPYYKLNTFCHDKGDVAVCPCGCGEELTGVFADTSIGHPDSWHGNIDLLLDGSVPVEIQEGFKMASPGGKNPYESEERRDIEELDVLSQTIAQTIVFSFVQKSKHPKRTHFLTPGICISPKLVAFHFYDCQHDVLLRSRAIRLVTMQGTINISALLAIWMVINYKHLCSGLPQTMIDEGHKAHFFEIAEEKIEIYRNRLQMFEVACVDEVDNFMPEDVNWFFD